MKMTKLVKIGRSNWRVLVDGAEAGRVHRDAEEWRVEVPNRVVHSKPRTRAEAVSMVELMHESAHKEKL